MREIRFKFWNRQLHRMSRPLGIGVIWEDLVEEWGVFDWKDIEKLQYTGLHDRRGREIYEGDILKHRGNSDLIDVVIWDEAACRWLMKTTKWQLTLFAFNDFNTMKAMIIGNIHENPELLP